jgi:succinate-semialdehyde dehydrogenase/glutarate-semialdehyde dehydrogenase
MPYQGVNPVTGKILQSFIEHSDRQMIDALTRADETFHRVWSIASCEERAEIIVRVASLMREQKEDLARLATLETGKRIEESRRELELSASIFQYYADNAEPSVAPRRLNSSAKNAHIGCSPLGVLIGIQPWNYPYYQLARFAAPNLMSGNVILLKHAPGVPQCSIAFERILNEAGLPAGAYTNLFLSNDQADALIDDPRIKGVAVTALAVPFIPSASNMASE